MYETDAEKHNVCEFVCGYDSAGLMPLHALNNGLDGGLKIWRAT